MNARSSSRRVTLRHQHLGVHAVPASRPVLVGPTHTERQVERRVCQVLQQRPLEQLLAGEPVEVEAEGPDAVEPRELDLAALHLGQAQVIEAKLTRQVRLVVADELRHGSRDVGPFGESAPPPRVVFNDRMELRQIERDQAHRRRVQRRRARQRDRFRLRQGRQPQRLQRRAAALADGRRVVRNDERAVRLGDLLVDAQHRSPVLEPPLIGGRCFPARGLPS